MSQCLIVCKCTLSAIVNHFQVDVECGAKEELSSVEEPSRCEYTAKMTTPACCSTEEAHAVQEQLDVAEKELTEREEL